MSCFYHFRQGYGCMGKIVKGKDRGKLDYCVSIDQEQTAKFIESINKKKQNDKKIIQNDNFRDYTNAYLVYVKASTENVGQNFMKDSKNRLYHITVGAYNPYSTNVIAILTA